MLAALETHATDGTRAHTYLTPAQVKIITGIPDQTNKGRRDYVILAVLVGVIGLVSTAKTTAAANNRRAGQRILVC